jgi:DNA-binding ferritin-like protein (Dps family)
MMKRANALPKEYRYAFRKMRDYIFTVAYRAGTHPVVSIWRCSTG